MANTTRSIASERAVQPVAPVGKREDAMASASATRTETKTVDAVTKERSATKESEPGSHTKRVLVSFVAGTVAFFVLTQTLLVNTLGTTSVQTVYNASANVSTPIAHTVQHFVPMSPLAALGLSLVVGAAVVGVVELVSRLRKANRAEGEEA